MWYSMWAQHRRRHVCCMSISVICVSQTSSSFVAPHLMFPCSFGDWRQGSLAQKVKTGALCSVTFFGAQCKMLGLYIVSGTKQWYKSVFFLDKYKVAHCTFLLCTWLLVAMRQYKTWWCVKPYPHLGRLSDTEQLGTKKKLVQRKPSWVYFFSSVAYKKMTGLLSHSISCSDHLVLCNFCL